MKNICLFAGFNPHGKIQPSVTYLLRELYPSFVIKNKKGIIA